MRRVDLNIVNCGTPALRSVITVRSSSRPIARVFRATAAPGCRDELLQRFHSSSAAFVNGKVGCLKYRLLEPIDAFAPEVVFESVWRDLDAVKVAFGDAWQQSHLPEHSALMTAYSVHHFLVARVRRPSNSPLSFGHDSEIAIASHKRTWRHVGSMSALLPESEQSNLLRAVQDHGLRQENDKAYAPSRRSIKGSSDSSIPSVSWPESVFFLMG